MTALTHNLWQNLERSDLETDLRRARILANLLDAQFQVLGFRFGLDPIIGLIPVVGDTLGAVAGMYLLWVARKHKLGKAVELRMLANLAVEWAGGLVPVAGELFDAGYKANLRNLAILEAAAARRRAR